MAGTAAGALKARQNKTLRKADLPDDPLLAKLAADKKASYEAGMVVRVTDHQPEPQRFSTPDLPHIPRVTPEPLPDTYIVGRRSIKHGDETFEPGEVFPYAHLLPRINSWLTTGMLVRV